jgi:hypothetical protein
MLTEVTRKVSLMYSREGSVSPQSRFREAMLCVSGIWPHGSDCEDYCLLFCDVMLSASVRNLLLPTSGYLSRSRRQQVTPERWVSFCHNKRRHIPEDILPLYSIAVSWLRSSTIEHDSVFWNSCTAGYFFERVIFRGKKMMCRREFSNCIISTEHLKTR